MRAVEDDVERMRRALLNLLHNALFASESGSLVVLEAKGDTAQVVLAITDCGKGMSPEVQQQAFTPFFTTRAQGTGLGLPLSQRIVEQHGGAISIASCPGQGTTVRIVLPQRAPEPSH